MEKTSKKSGSKGKLIVAVIMAGALFLAELYVIIQMPHNIALLAGFGIGMLIALCLAVSAMVDCVNGKDLANAERYEGIQKSEKASYVLLKKRLEQLSNQVEALQEVSNKDDNLEEIIKTQKSVAKIIINKNKEAQDRLFIELNNIEASLTDRVRELSKRLSGFQEEIERLADHIALINTEAIQEAVKNSLEATMALREPPQETKVTEEIAEEDLKMDSIGFDFEELESESEPISEPEPIPTPPPAAKPADDGGKMGQDDIAALIASMTGTEAEQVSPEPIPTPPPVAKPADDGGKMGQDDIAALIASMTGAEAEQVSPEPIPTPPPAAKPADDGGKMGQDDIAALIASMTGGM